MKTTNNNNFKFNDILDGVLEGVNIEHTISALEAINNSYSRQIVFDLVNENYEEAIAKLKKSCAFERNMNSEKTTSIILTDEEILARRDNLMIINGLSKEEATLLAYRRAERLKSTSAVVYNSIESGTFLL